MRIALLVPGQSIATSWCNEQASAFDCVVAVNTTGHVYACDWLAAIDHHVVAPVIAGKALRPRLGIVGRRAYEPGALKAGLKFVPAAPYAGKDMEGRGFGEQARRERCGYTMPNALWWCAKLGATALEIFGMDFSGVDGFKSLRRGSHSSGRWSREAAWLRGYWLPGTIVHGTIKPERLAFIAGKRQDWPG